MIQTLKCNSSYTLGRGKEEGGAGGWDGEAGGGEGRAGEEGDGEGSSEVGN